MRSNSERAKQYRDRAAEIRSAVAEWKDSESRAHMLAAAQIYDELAADTERGPDLAEIWRSIQSAKSA